MFASRMILIALSTLPAATLFAQTAPAPAPPMRMQAPNMPARPSPFDEMDTNHDGFVSRDEFVAYQKKRFDEFDTNHDARIDAKEIASSPPLMERNLRTAERMVKQWDTNSDGIVSAEEFKKASEDRFAKQDKQGTGKIARPGSMMPPKGQLMPNPVQPQPPAKKP